MYLKKNSNFIKKLDVRLALMFSFLFLLGSLILSGITSSALFSAIRERDQEDIRHHALEYWARFQIEGPEGLFIQFQAEHFAGEVDEYLVRFANSQNETLFLRIPDRWNSFNFLPMIHSSLSNPGKFLQIKSPVQRYNIEVTTILLESGYFLQIGKSTEDRYALQIIYIRVFFSVLVFLVLLSFTGGIIVSSRSIAPIRKLNHTIKSILNTGKITSRITERAREDEMDELIGSFNKMLSRIERLISGMKTTMDNIAHDLRTPLTRFRGVAELALQKPEDEQNLREALSEGMEQSEYILKMINAILDIAAAESGVLPLRKTNVNIASVCKEVIDLYQFIGEEKQIRIHGDFPEILYLDCDEGKIRQVIGNLIDNAIKYSPPEKEVQVKTKIIENQAAIEIIDNGPGIDSEDLPHIWDRLYRGKPRHGTQGLGLGLSIVKAIVYAHNGRTEVENLPSGGSCFRILLPIA